MTVLLFERRFWQPVVSGEKVHSIRRTRKRPIVPGESLSLRAWEGRPYRSRMRVLCEETCIAVRECWIDRSGIVIDQQRFGEPDELDAFARSDGFASWEHMKLYRDFFYRLPFAGDLIQWGAHPLLAHLAIHLPAKPFRGRRP
ncbi:MAG TPA: hypothetical protein VGG64_08810 [Pirellulales bacterium]|jgi:hypothetical protein